MSAQTTSPRTDGSGAAGTSRPRRTGRAAASDVAGLGIGRAVLFVVPALALIAAFLVFPALWTLYLGVLKYDLAGSNAAAPQFVGLGNYTDALTDPRFANSVLLTLAFVGLSAVIGQNGLGFVLAATLRRAAGWVRTLVSGLVLLSWILPGTVVVFLWQALLDRNGGTLNALLGTPGAAWTLDHPLATIVVFNVWRGTAFSMLLYSAALDAVPTSHLETARLYGSGPLRTFRDVVLPRIRGHILTNTLLITLWTFNDFTPYMLTGGGPEHRSETLPVYVYRMSIEGGQLGFGSAISLIMLVINLVIALFYLRLLRRRGG
ncbi:sugar ABC transporter permease [Actinocatenispora sera]|uniref:Amino acid ABC transporter permease n=1 Tax=Actinocatenispora sera TaxID=390989 RepID=A0A810L4U3_9ACTN|nr:sugar ABC transporter permease [Actinocatenispora sera]BCJ30383.1 amino acid ABC transporter permease [Actinocatenispora sera]